MVARRSVPWQDAARMKADETWAKIPAQWRLDPSIIEEAQSRTDITGGFIEKLLSSDEVKITSFHTIALALAIRDRDFTAQQVTTAFCKRAAIAHQLVCRT